MTTNCKYLLKGLLELLVYFDVEHEVGHRAAVAIKRPVDETYDLERNLIKQYELFVGIIRIIMIITE